MSTSAQIGISHQVRRFLMRSRRQLYCLRAFVPGLGERHRLEAMVGPLGFWNKLQAYHLELLSRNGLKPHHTLLDIGCGPLQGGIGFIRHLEPGGYCGVDIDPVRMDAAHEQVGRHKLSHKKPRLIVSGTFGDPELNGHQFDFMWASQILYYFGDEMMHRLLSMIRSRLRNGGQFLGDTFAPDHYEFRHPEHPGKYVRHTIESLTAQAERHGLQVRCLGVIGDFGYPRRLSLPTNPLYRITHR